MCELSDDNCCENLCECGDCDGDTECCNCAGDPEPDIPEGELCEIDDKVATCVHDGIFYCDDCYITQIQHD